METCNTFLVEGKEPGRRGRNLAATVWKSLLEQFEEFRAIEYPDSSKIALFKPSTMTVSKREELDAIATQADFIFNTYADPVTTMGAFMLLVWRSWPLRSFITTLLCPPCSMTVRRSVSEAMITGAISEEEKALGALKNVLSLSGTLKESSEWVSKSIVVLNAIKPKEYPLEKPDVWTGNPCSCQPLDLAPSRFLLKKGRSKS